MRQKRVIIVSISTQTALPRKQDVSDGVKVCAEVKCTSVRGCVCVCVGGEGGWGGSVLCK